MMMLSNRTMQIRSLSPRTTTNDVSKHENNVNEDAKQENDGK